MWTYYEKRVVISTLELVLEHTVKPDFEVRLIVPTPFIPIKTGRAWLEAGICDLLTHILPHSRQEDEYLQTLWKKWPRYSGDPRYPVPSPLGSVLSERQIFGHAHAPEMWSPTSAYGALRRDLCEFIIATLKQELSQNDN